MGFWGRYVEYLKDNPEGYWFRSKVYGWGWFPATWEGWLTLGVYLAVFTWLLVNFMGTPEPSDEQVLRFVLKIFLWTALLMLVCWKTGEPLKWQWGIPDKKE